jgi:hypothetical protein
VIHAEFPLDRAADAHRMMEESQHIGKIVLVVSPHPQATPARSEPLPSESR